MLNGYNYLSVHTFPDMVKNICEQHSIASAYLSQLRDVKTQADRAVFRHNLRRLGAIFAYEISKTFEYVMRRTETPLGVALSHVPEDPVVLVTILRAGLPMHDGMLDFLGRIENGFVATQRLHHKDGSFEVEVDYIQCPDVEGKTVIICDPMLATGSSIVTSLEAVREIGRPAKVHVVSVIATTAGINYVKRYWPKADFWVAAIDEEMTAKSLIVPGLGDAGDLAYGGKRDSF